MFGFFKKKKKEEKFIGESYTPQELINAIERLGGLEDYVSIVIVDKDLGKYYRSDSLKISVINSRLVIESVL